LSINNLNGFGWKTKTKMKIYAKRKRINKLKQHLTKITILSFALIGFLYCLNCFIDYISVPRTTMILNKSVPSLVSTGDESDISPDIATLKVVSKESEEPRPSNSPAGLIVKKIMMLESSGGKNNYSKCEAIGKYNRYGYGIPGDGTYRCYEKDEDTKAVENWFEEKLNEMDLATAACYYNTGTKTQDCPYYKNFINI